MKRNAENIRMILEVMGLLVLFLAYEHLVGARLTWLAISVWAAIWLIGIVNKIRYLRGRDHKTLRIPTVNDEFIRVSGYFLGGFLTAGALAWMIFAFEITFFQPTLFVAGMLLLTNALLHVPNGVLKISARTIRLAHKRRIPIDSVRTVIIGPGELKITDVHGRTVALRRLALDEETMAELRSFIETRMAGKPVHIEIELPPHSVHSHS